MTELPESWRRVLLRRSMRDKIGIAVDCDLCPVGDLTTVAELVREGIMVWLDRARLPMVVQKDDRIVRIGVNTEIYLLTPKGVALCDAHSIARS